MKIFPLILFLSLLAQHITVSAEQKLTVQVKETKLRSAPTQWSSSVATLKYGDSIEALKVENDWVEGQTGSMKKGFVHASAMSTKKVILSGSKNQSAELDPTEVILAGKGFSKATEDEFSKANSGSDFRAVNAVEAITVSDAEVRAFMSEGKIGERAK